MEISELYDLFLQHPVVTTDTRDCPESSLFFALKGEKFDGNAFAHQAIEAGCAFAIVDDAEVASRHARCLLVPDVLATLQSLARHHRLALGTPILQITGTNGKTTTKELTAAVLTEKYRLLYTLGNFNNHIGVPKTLLRMTQEHEFAVIETGANHVGEIAELSHIVEADCGVITNVGKAHLEGFGSFEGVVRTKTELYAHLCRANAHRGESAFVFLNADNALLVSHAEHLPRFTYGGVGKGYDVEGEVVECNPFLCFRWRKQGGEWHEAVQTQLIGAYNLDNLLVAVSAGVRFGVPESAIDRALMAYAPNNNRSEFRKTEKNRLVIDAYNANLSSMQAALENFRIIPDARKMMILGDMRELGETSAACHAEVAQLAATVGCTKVWLVGDNFAHVFSSLPANTTTQFRHFPDVEAVKAELRACPIADELVLIKGSNGTKLFQLPEFL